MERLLLGAKLRTLSLEMGMPMRPFYEQHSDGSHRQEGREASLIVHRRQQLNTTNCARLP